MILICLQVALGGFTDLIDAQKTKAFTLQH